MFILFREEAFCRAAFVIRGIVKNSRTLESSWVEFDVEVKDNFKNKVNNMIKVRSPKNSRGVRLTTGSEYLITGEVRSYSPYGRFYYTRLCFSVQILWQDISKDTQTALKTGTFTTC
ncbi:uncharacterized protein [Mytilus edulis]|uniref:uncharacterized protein n=1 Tax=Mytilus edulis TaxID=6550 RepID=UPI0039F00CC9